VAIIAVVLATASTVAVAQGPQIDTGAPPGVPDARNKIGPALGASGGVSFETSPILDRPIGGRAGPSASRAPIGGLAVPSGNLAQAKPAFQPRQMQLPEVPAYGELDLPEGSQAFIVGEEGGMTLETAIGLLIQRNLDLIALRFEIPMADADVLTAGLRANPVFYADSQLIPYGRYTNTRPGGPTQEDVNVTFPLDVTHKRKARIVVAREAKKVTEAQFQDAVRQSVDNLYNAYVRLGSAELTLNYSRAFLAGLIRLRDLFENRLRLGRVAQDKVDSLRAQVELAQLQERQAIAALVAARRDLGLMLNFNREQSDAIRIHDNLRNVDELPESLDALVTRALKARPDLLAYRYGLGRANADVVLAERNRYSDVYLLVQPYTFQNNTYLGLHSPTSWAVGLTANVPVFNRNQGNVKRAKINARQTQVELASQERQVMHDVEDAVRQFELTRQSVIEIENEVIPASRRVRDTALNRVRAGETNPEEYLEAQRQFNEVVKQYRDALTAHREDMLDLNTAVSVRLFP
jgi:cobalt-zinc-cadmium efflux system outer membrane protein